MHQTQFSQKIPYGGFSQIRSHILLCEKKKFSLIAIKLICGWSENFLKFHYSVQKDSTKTREEGFNQECIVLGGYVDACLELWI